MAIPRTIAGIEDGEKYKAALDALGITHDEYQGMLRRRVQGQSNVPLVDTLASYLRYLEHAGGKPKSPLTIISYRETLDSLVDFVSRECLVPRHQVRVLDLSEEYLASFLADEVQKGNKAQTFNRKLAVLNGFLKYLRKNGLADIKHDIVRMKEAPGLPLYLLDNDVSRLLQASRCQRYAIRDHAMVGTFLMTGIRREELCELRISRINFKTGEVEIHGKGRKTRILMLGPALDLIKDYLRYRGHEGYPAMIQAQPGHEDFLFLNHEGKGRGTKMSPYAVYRIIVRLFVKLGLRDAGRGKQRAVHALRHTIAVTLIRTCDIAVVRDFLGHANLATTSVYLRLRTEDVQRAVLRHNPFAQAILHNARQLGIDLGVNMDEI